MSDIAVQQPEDLGTPVTLEGLQKLMPKRQKSNITPKFVDTLNNLIQDPEEREVFRETFLGYVDVLKDPQTTLPGYMQAVRYVSYKLLGDTNEIAWVKAFPERYQKMIDDGRLPLDPSGKSDTTYLRSVVSAYNRGKMVQQLLEQTMVPAYVANQDIYQKAIATQANLMITAKSEKVRSDAANSLLTHLKPPEATKLSIDVNVEDGEEVKELRGEVMRLVKATRDAIGSGAITAQEAAESKIINGSATRVDN